MNELKFKKAEKIKAVKWLDSVIDSLDDNTAYTVKIEKAKKKRSLSANAYFWSLCDSIAKRMSVSKEDIYRGYVKNCGGNSEYLRVETKAVPMLKKTWEMHGIGWQVETVPSGFDGWTDVILYYGSSMYDSATMARLINLAVQDCRTLDIPTLDDVETDNLIAEFERGVIK